MAIEHLLVSNLIGNKSDKFLPTRTLLYDSDTFLLVFVTDYTLAYCTYILKVFLSKTGRPPIYGF
jgi:hypothetical protein